MIIKPATEAQLSFLRSLVAERELSPHAREMLAAFPPERLNSHEASVMIDLVKKCERKVTAPTTARTEAGSQLAELLSAVPKSKYALRFEEIGDAVTGLPSYGNDALFVEVREFKQRRYIRRLHGNVGGFTRTRLSVADSVTILRMIAADPLAGTQLFGQLHSCCGCCGADLTDELSRSLNLGPECRKRFGL